MVNRLRNNIFVNPPPLPLLCEISGALHLAQPGLTAGWLADEIQVNFEIFKVGYRSKYSSYRFVLPRYMVKSKSCKNLTWLYFNLKY